jgi:membrane-bound inhibitor of C-type lysozyme
MQSNLRVASFIVGLIGLAMVGCTGNNESQAEGNLVTFSCPGGETIEAVFSGDSTGEVTVTLPDQEAMVLPQVEAASGAKYSDGTTTFWSKGDEALVEVNGEMMLQNCTAE